MNLAKNNALAAILGIILLLVSACGGPGSARSISGPGGTPANGAIDRDLAVDHLIRTTIGDDNYVSNAAERRCVRALPDDASAAQIRRCLDKN